MNMIALPMDLPKMSASMYTAKAQEIIIEETESFSEHSDMSDYLSSDDSDCSSFSECSSGYEETVASKDVVNEIVNKNKLMKLHNAAVKVERCDYLLTLLPGRSFYGTCNVSRFFPSAIRLRRPAKLFNSQDFVIYGLDEAYDSDTSKMIRKKNRSGRGIIKPCGLKNLETGKQVKKITKDNDVKCGKHNKTIISKQKKQPCTGNSTLCMVRQCDHVAIRTGNVCARNNHKANIDVVRRCLKYNKNRVLNIEPVDEVNITDKTHYVDSIKGNNDNDIISVLPDGIKSENYDNSIYNQQHMDKTQCSNFQYSDVSSKACTSELYNGNIKLKEENKDVSDEESDIDVENDFFVPKLVTDKEIIDHDHSYAMIPGKPIINREESGQHSKHSSSERKRRDVVKKLFVALRDILPDVCFNLRTSRQRIIDSACSEIIMLNTKNVDLTSEHERLKHFQKILLTRIKCLR